MKRFQPLAVLALLLLTACNRDPLVGRWERIGDDFAGTIVQVGATGKSYMAKLVDVPEKLKTRGFARGEVKWRELVLVSDSEGVRKYKGQDLGKSIPREVQNPKSKIQNPTESRYSSFALEMRADTAWVRVFQNDLDVLGVAQIWRKIK